jgi:ABC-type sugar transport system ATPase subunit
VVVAEKKINMAVGITLNHLSWQYRRKPVVTDITLSVAPGEILAILGPSGSGKSTILRLILGFEAPTSGYLCLDDRMVAQDRKILVPPEDRELAVVFQDLALWPHLTVQGNLEFGLKARGVPAAERESRLADMLQKLNLAGMARRYPGTLSGGERQRVAIARALVLSPQAVLMDEPLASLDVVLRSQLLSVFREVLQEAQITVIYVTHDLREAARLADRMAILEKGRLVQIGNLGDLKNNPATPFVAGLLAEL